MKKTKFLVVGAAIFVLLGFWAVSENFSIFADTKSTNKKGDSNGIHNLTGDTPAIFLDSEYSSEQVRSALAQTTGQVNTESAKIKSEVTSEFRLKARDLANQIDTKYRALSAKKGGLQAEAESVVKDVVINIFDKTGKGISPPVSSSQKVGSVADNYEFDASVDQETKDTFIKVYPQLEGVFGPRLGTQKIKIFIDQDLSRSYYCMGEIHLSPDDQHSNPTVIHELAHAFHYDSMPWRVWEEGLATAASSLIESESYNKPYVEMGYRMLAVSNLPYRTFRDDYYYMEGWYSWGGATFDKLRIEDANFFKNFNAKYYELSETDRSSEGKYSLIATQVLDKVEGVSAESWLQSNYGLKESYLSSGEGFYATPYLGDGPVLTNSSYSGLWISKAGCYDDSCDELSDYQIKVFDINGKLLSEMSEVGWLTRGPSAKDKAYIDYYGLVKVEISKKSDPDKKYYSYLGKTKDSYSPWLTGISLSGGDIVEITNIAGGVKIVTEVKNGMFGTNDIPVGVEGKYEARIYTRKDGCTDKDLSACKGKEIASKRFNSYGRNSNYGYDYNFIIIGSPKDQCKTKLSNVKSLNRSFKLDISASENCGHVLSINNEVYDRYLGKANSLQVQGLKKSMEYNVTVLSAFSNADAFAIKKKIKTTAYKDLVLLKAENIGSPGVAGYKRRLTFSSPVAQLNSDVGLYLMGTTEGESSSAIGIKVSYPTPSVIEITPTSPLYYNAEYYIDGIDTTTDRYGNPLCDFDYSVAVLKTPLNPKTKVAPAYSIKNKYFEASNRLSAWIISKNFLSNNLIKKSKKVKTYPYYSNYTESCDEYLGCSVESSVIIAPSSIAVFYTKALKLNMTHSVHVPWTITNDNNFVPSYYGEFTTKPKKGTNAPKLVSSDPQASSKVKNIPKQIKLTFNNKITSNLDEILVCAGGECLDKQDLKLSFDEKTLIITPNKALSVSPYSKSVLVYFGYIQDEYGNYINGYEPGHIEFFVE